MSDPHLEAVSWCCDEHRQQSANDWMATQAVVTAAQGVMLGFDGGIWGRSVAQDHEPGWALKFVPHLQKLAALQRALAVVAARTEGRAELHLSTDELRGLFALD